MQYLEQLHSIINMTLMLLWKKNPSLFWSETRVIFENAAVRGLWFNLAFILCCHENTVEPPTSLRVPALGPVDFLALS